MKTVIIGGGVIGLSLAYELATRGHQVVLLEKQKFGRKASWAGAGMLSPTNRSTAIHPLEHLEALSHQVHAEWSKRLESETGINNGFRKCGGLYMARTAGEVAALAGLKSEWRERQIEFQDLELVEIKNRFRPFSMCRSGSTIAQASWVPGQAQFSTPDHIRALIAACHELGVSMHEELGDVEIVRANHTVEAVKVGTQDFTGDIYVLAAGPWTEQLVEGWEFSLPMQPVRGQIALYKINLEDGSDGQSIASGPIVNEGSRYLVPRTDGHVLAGATIEEVGFDCRPTENEVKGLRKWAESVSEELNESTFVKSWAGLRPGTYDGFPYMGRLEGASNAFVSTGHFKGGLHLSTGAAVVMADLFEGKKCEVDIKLFSPSRVLDHQSIDNK